MSSNKYADFRKVIYYYWSDIMTNNNKGAKPKYYRSLIIENVYLDDNSLKYRNQIINYFQKNVLCLINELNYSPPIKIGRFHFQGGYFYHELKYNFENKLY
jgi:hypothetical protein